MYCQISLTEDHQKTRSCHGKITSQHVLWDKDSVRLPGLTTVCPAAVAYGSASLPVWGMTSESEGNHIHTFPGSAAKSLLLDGMFTLSSSASSSSLDRSPATWLLPSERLRLSPNNVKHLPLFFAAVCLCVSFLFQLFADIDSVIHVEITGSC